MLRIDFPIHQIRLQFFQHGIIIAVYVYFYRIIIIPRLRNNAIVFFHQLLVFGIHPAVKISPFIRSVFQADFPQLVTDRMKPGNTGNFLHLRCGFFRYDIQKAVRLFINLNIRAKPVVRP